MTDSSDVEQGLIRLLAAEVEGAEDISVTGLSRTGGGSSRENWAFDASWTLGGNRVREALLLRRDPVASVVETDREREFRLLGALAPTSLPTPIPRWIDLAGAHLERPVMVMVRHHGRADRGVLGDANPLGLEPAGRVALAEELCDLLVDLHRLDTGAPALTEALGTPPADPAAAELAHWESVIAMDSLEPQPALRLAAHWLRAHLPPPPLRPTIVHGDFRPANTLVADGRVTVLLDWEFAHWGDPLEDLGWYCTPVYAREHFIAGAWSPADFLARYEAGTGHTVDKDALRFWEVLALLKLAAILVTGIRNFCDGTTPRAASPGDRFTASVLSLIETLDAASPGHHHDPVARPTGGVA